MSMRKKVTIGSILILLGLAILLAVFFFQRQRFSSQTYISGIDCSYLTVEQAKEKIEKNMNEKISFVFQTASNKAEYRTYEAKPEEIAKFDLIVSDEKIIEQALEQQHKNKEEKEFESPEMFLVNEKAVKEYLSPILEGEKKSMIPSKNAYLEIGKDSLLKIVPETYGNEVDFEKAYQLAIKSLKEGDSNIDFSSLINKPTVLASNSNLIEAQNEANRILSTNVKIKLNDGSIVLLDAQTIKNWIEPTEDGVSVIVNVEKNVPLFVDSIAEKVSSSGSKLVFSATGIGKITMPVRQAIRPSLNKEESIKKILEVIGTTQEEPITLTYSGNSVSNMLSSYIELDITRQTVWVYKNGKCILETPCVTGNVVAGHSTPTGIYFLNYKTTNTVLRGNNDDGSKYASPVSYWMPFNGGVGFHDATWRGRFGGSIYKTNGSHGCVNLPLGAAKTLYQNINNSMPIIIYKS